jgi:hypothetical protein
MGKKTDKFITDLTALGDKCEGFLTKVIQATDAMEANNDEWDQTLRSGGDMNAMETKRAGIWEEGMKQKRDLLDALNELSAKLSEFDKFVTKRSKSKNPFRNKKAITAAKDMLRVYNEFHGAATKAYNELSGAFQ